MSILYHDTLNLCSFNDSHFLSESHNSLIMMYNLFYRIKYTRVSNIIMLAEKTNKTMKQMELVERRDQAMSLRLDGYTYREIAEIMYALSVEGKLIIPDSYDERYAYRDVNNVLKQAQNELFESAEQLRIMELRNLNRLQNAIMPKALRGDLKALDRILKIMAQREKYVPDLTLPKTVKIESWQNEILVLIQEGKVTIEDIKNDYPQLAERILAELPNARKQAGITDGSVTIEGEYTDLGRSDEELPRESDL